MNERKSLAIVNGGKYYALAVVAMAMLTACTNDGASEVLNKETAEVRMTFSPYEVEPLTRAAVADYATRLDVWVYDGDTEIQAVHQKSTDEGLCFAFGAAGEEQDVHGVCRGAQGCWCGHTEQWRSVLAR